MVLNRGLAYGPYDINRILLISDPMLAALLSNPMPAALLSDPMIRLTPIFDISAVFWI